MSEAKSHPLPIPTADTFVHIPVLLEETVGFILQNRQGIYVDGTTGEGGHSLFLAQQLDKEASLSCFDLDPRIQEKAKRRLASFPQVQFILSNFANLASYFPVKSIDGICLDLGLSMYHYKEDKQSGFSFLENAPLHMILDSTDTHMTAQQIIHEYSIQELTDIFWIYGEETYAKKIAEAIGYYRMHIGKIEQTHTLIQIIEAVKPKKRDSRSKTQHPATKVFQALRIYLNREWENIERFFQEGLPLLKHKGRISILTYHSLEDKLVQKLCKQYKSGYPRIHLHPPIYPTQEEIQGNRAARSAILRRLEIHQEEEF